MKILGFSRRMAVLLGVCSPEENDSLAKTRQRRNIVLILINLVPVEFALITYAVHEMKVGNILEFLNGVVHVAATTTTLLSYTSILYQRQNTRQIFDELQSIFDKCNFFKLRFLFNL